MEPVGKPARLKFAFKMRINAFVGLVLGFLTGGGTALLTARHGPFVVSRPPGPTGVYRLTALRCSVSNSKQDLPATELLHHQPRGARHERSKIIDAVLATLEAESPVFDIPYEKIAEVESKENSQSSAHMHVPAIYRHDENISKAVARWKRRDGDVGSPEVQIAIAHERIRYLTAHMLSNKKDFASKRGLQALVVARRKMLEYLSRVDPVKARLISNELGIRFQLPGQEWDKHTRYGAFRNTKSKHAKTAKAR